MKKFILLIVISIYILVTGCTNTNKTDDGHKNSDPENVSDHDHSECTDHDHGKDTDHEQEEFELNSDSSEPIDDQSTEEHDH